MREGESDRWKRRTVNGSRFVGGRTGPGPLIQSMLCRAVVHKLRSALTPSQYLRRRRALASSTTSASAVASVSEMDAVNTSHKVIIVGGGPAGTHPSSFALSMPELYPLKLEEWLGRSFPRFGTGASPPLTAEGLAAEAEFRILTPLAPLCVSVGFARSHRLE